MSFGFRKSVSAGPFRLNFSKAGVGISAGVKGARVGVNSKGTYIQVGYSGVYYRKFVSHKNAGRVDPGVSPAKPGAGEQSSHEENLQDALQLALTESSPSELLEKLKRSRAVAWEAYVVGALLLAVIYSSSVTAAVLAAVGGFLVVRWWGRWRRQAKLLYSLDEAGRNTLGSLQQIITYLSRAQRLWYMAHAEASKDRKYTGGAGIMVKRKAAKAGPLKMPGIKTNVEVYGLSVERGPSFFFMPDGLYIYDKGNYGLYPYKSQKWSQVNTRFIEEERPPNDAEQVDTTFKYVNKRGGPDKRFKVNPQLPVMRYGDLSLRAGSGAADFQVSNTEIAEGAGAAFNDLAQIVSDLKSS